MLCSFCRAKRKAPQLLKRFSTLSSSFKRTARSITCSRPFRAPTTRTGLAKCAVSPSCPNGNHVVRLKPQRLDNLDLPHGHGDFLREYDQGKMDGFNQVNIGGQGQLAPPSLYPYQYVYPNEIAPYWDMAKQYALADHMFQTQGSGSFVGHQDLIRGSTSLNDNESVTDEPSAPNGIWGCDSTPGNSSPGVRSRIRA